MQASALCKRSLLPPLQGARSHHALWASFGQRQLHNSHCSVPAGSPFSLGGPHAVSASCKHLPPPAYACIPLCPSASHLSASLCVAVGGLLLLLLPPVGKQPNLTKQGLLEAVHALFPQRPFALCALYNFFNYVAPGSSAIHLEQAGFLPAQQRIYSPARAGTESVHLGGMPRCGQTTKS